MFLIYVCVVMFVCAHALEKLNEEPGVALHHVRLQVRQRDQLVEELDEEDVVLLAEPPAVQLQKPEGERSAVSERPVASCLPCNS